VICTPEQAVEVVAAMTKVFARNGNRGNRGKARLVYLLKEWGFEKFVAESEAELGYTLTRMDAAQIPLAEEGLPEIPHPHLGAHPQKQEGLQYLGVSTPVGIVQADEVEAICRVAEEFGDGELRLSIFQNVIVPNIPSARIAAAREALAAAGLACEVSRFRGGLVACTGNRYCKYAAADTKGQGVALADFIDSKLELDRPINVHVTGCPHSCAQHYIGDIGLLGCKVDVAGEAVEGFHVFVGGGFGREKNLGRQLFKSLPVGEPLQHKVLALLRAYMAERAEGQSFQEFSLLHSIEDLLAFTEAQEVSLRGDPAPAT
jgi:ferredoxin-nitrite reductase